MRLGDVCTVITDGSHFSPKDVGKGYPMMSVKDMEDKDFSFRDCKYISEEDYQTLLKNGCKPQVGDVLLAKDGSYFKYAFVIEHERELVVLSSIAILRPNIKLIDPLYLREFLMAESTYNTVSLNYISGTALKRVILQGIKKIEIPLPSLPMQQKIARQFIAIDNLISLRKQQLAKLDELVKARFVELFDLENCERKSLGECTDFVDYRGHTPELSDEGTIRMVNAKSVGKGFFKYVDEYITEETYDSWMHRGFGYAGDILFVTEGHTFGNTCLIPDDMTKFALGQRVITIKGHKDIYNAFLCSYMQTDMFWQDINVYRTGGTAQGIRSKDLVKVTVPIPSLDLQEKFVCFVKQTDKSKSAIQQSLEKLETLKGALMQKYFG